MNVASINDTRHIQNLNDLLGDSPLSIGSTMIKFDVCLVPTFTSKSDLLRVCGRNIVVALRVVTEVDSNKRQESYATRSELRRLADI